MRRKVIVNNLPTASKRISPLPPLRPYARCACGTCSECVSDAHWDRVFAKFEVKEDRGGNQSRSPIADL